MAPLLTARDDIKLFLSSTLLFMSAKRSSNKKNIVNMHYPWSVNHNSLDMYSFILFLWILGLSAKSFPNTSFPVRLLCASQRDAHSSKWGDILGAAEWKWFARFFKCSLVKKHPAQNGIINMWRTLPNIDG